MSIEKAKEFLATLKEKETDETLKGKAAAANTREEKLALLTDIAHEMGYDVTEADIKKAMEPDDLVALEDDVLDGVAGGYKPFFEKSKKHVHTWEKTGNTRPGRLVGLIDDVEYRCTTCGAVEWKNW